MLINKYSDIFKEHKILEGKLQGKGQAKIVHCTELGRKVLAVTGLVSGENYASISVKLSSSYLYFLCKPTGKIFGFTILGHCSGKKFKLRLSSHFK